jgi:hypothetical protein
MTGVPNMKPQVPGLITEKLLPSKSIIGSLLSRAEKLIMFLYILIAALLWANYCVEMIALANAFSSSARLPELEVVPAIMVG